MIKIGCTSNPANRFKNLRTDDMEPKDRPSFRILGFKFGDLEEEQTIHASLAAHTVKGREYYSAHPDVLAIVNDWRADLGRDPIAPTP
jgi:hypothetical protein